MNSYAQTPQSSTSQAQSQPEVIWHSVTNEQILDWIPKMIQGINSPEDMNVEYVESLFNIKLDKGGVRNFV